MAEGQAVQVSAMRNLGRAFITGTAAFLPGEPVDIDAMEDHLGRIGVALLSSVDERCGRTASNGVTIVTPDGAWTHNNASMSAEAVRRALGDAGLDLGDLAFLATATTQGDLLVPGHASAVHGELGGGAAGARQSPVGLCLLVDGGEVRLAERKRLFSC